MTAQKPVETETGFKPHRSIAAALAAAQSEMGRAKKSATNPHFKRQYADLDSVCDAALPALNRHGIAVVQPLEARGEAWVQITRFVHGESGEAMETPVPLIIGKNDMQGLGSAMTYARRYGLMALAGIAPEDDDGNAAAESARRNPPPPRQEPKPEEPSRHAIEATKSSLGNADTLDRLRAIFTDLPPAIKAHSDVIAAKDERKAALEQSPPPAITDDEIPY